MDMFIISFSIAVGVFVITSIVVLIRIRLRRKQNQGKIFESPVVVTSTTHTAPGGYTVAQMPLNATTTTYQTQVYAAPYPPQVPPTQMPMPMPMNGTQPPMGTMPHIAPYPPMSTSAAANMNPPPYDVAVSGFGSGAPNNQPSYEKQSAYNPNFSM